MKKQVRSTRVSRMAAIRGLVAKALSRRQRRNLFRAVLLCGGALSPSAVLAQTGLPTGGQVAAGAAAIAAAGSTLDVNATSARTIVNWDSFSIGQGNTANFNLPDANAAILNRVTGGDISSIQGALNSNGNVFLVNPSGIMVGQTGMINTNGFTASVFDIDNADFLSGGALTFAGDSTGSIINDGTITTGEGGAHLIANEIRNNGTIESVGGNITLTGGGRVELNNGVTYSQPTLDTLGTGVSPTVGLIQNTGMIRATGAATTGGEVYLVNPNGKMLNDGTITAQRDVSSIASSSTGTETLGGSVMIEADDITLTENSVIDATGTHGGGEVLVGGDWEGGKEEPEFASDLGGNSSDAFVARREVMTQATKVLMESGAVIDASATQQGDGGKIVLWSDITNADSVTEAFGTLLAKAGTLFGDGGYIETSGARIDTSGISAIASAANGLAGLWLIDPFDYFIDATAAGNIVSALEGGTSVTVTTTADASNYGSSGSGEGNITIGQDIIVDGLTNDVTLTLRAHKEIEFRNDIDATPSVSSNTSKLNVVLWAEERISRSGPGNSDIKTNGGHVWMGGDQNTGTGTTWNGLAVGSGGTAGGISMPVIDTRGVGSDGSVLAYGGVPTSDDTDYDIRTSQAQLGAGSFTVLSNQSVYAFNLDVVTTGGDVTIASDVNGLGSGTINAPGMSIATGGGDITLGGGNTAGTGFAMGNDDQRTGIRVEAGLTLNSAGGDIAIRGMTRGNANFDFTGIESTGATSIDSGSGKILIHGVNEGSTINGSQLHGVAFNGLGSQASNSLTITSANTSADAIRIIGDASAVDSEGTGSRGLVFHADSSSITATGLGGGITLEGHRAHDASTAIQMGGGEVLANGGAINVSALASDTDRSGRLSLGGVVFGKKAGSSVTASSSDISFVSRNTDLDVATVDTAGNFSLLSEGDDFYNGSTFDATILNADDVTIGKSTSTKNITLGQSLNFAGDLSVTGADIELTQAITGAGSSTVQIAAIGNVSDTGSGAISAGNLLFTGTGDVNLDSATNDVSTLASSTTGSLSYIDANAMTIGTVGATAGITSQDTINVSTLTGDLTVANNVSTTNTSNSAVTLNADSSASAGTPAGGNILITGGSTVTVGTDGRATLFSGGISGSTGLTALVGSGSGRFRYNSDESSTGYTKAIGSGVHAIYREHPDYIASGSFSESFTYGDQATSAAINGDQLAIEADTPSTSTSGNLIIGNYAASFTSDAGADLGYNSATGSGTLEVTKRAITTQGLAVADRIYDATRVAVVDHSGVTFDNMVAGDVLTAADTTGLFDTKDVGTDKSIALTGTTYGGADLGNYTITDQTSTTATINKRPVTVSGLTAADKVYDGQTTSTLDLSGAVFTGLIDGETVTIADTVGTFADKNVGVNKTVNLSGSHYGGADVGNYVFTDQPSTTASISRLDSVNWVGGTSGNWSDASNWAGGAIPDLANVANVVIPGGSTVAFDSSVAGPVQIDSLTAGNFEMNSGGLQVAANFIADAFAQLSGTLQVGGDFTTKTKFSQQSGAMLNVAGDAAITHTDHDLTIQHLAASNIEICNTDGDVTFGNVSASGSLTAKASNGDISQLSSSHLTVGGPATLTASGDVDLSGGGNDFESEVNASGKNVSLSDAAGDLTLGKIAASCNLTANSTAGNLLQSADSEIDVACQSRFTVLGDLILDGFKNNFLGAVSLDARSADVRQQASELVLGDVTASGAATLWVKMGLITQTSKSKLDIGGAAKLFSEELNLPNLTNGFGGNVLYTAKQPILRSSQPILTLDYGLKTDEIALDAFTRYAGQTNDPANTSSSGASSIQVFGRVSQQLADTFVAWLTQFEGTGQLSPFDFSTDGREIFIRKVGGDQESQRDIL